MLLTEDPVYSIYKKKSLDEKVCGIKYYIFIPPCIKIIRGLNWPQKIIQE